MLGSGDEPAARSAMCLDVEQRGDRQLERVLLSTAIHTARSNLLLTPASAALRARGHARPKLTALGACALQLGVEHLEHLVVAHGVKLTPRSSACNVPPGGRLRLSRRGILAHG
jgi:hypothetical protein